MKRSIIIVMSVLCFGSVEARNVSVESPDGNIELSVDIGSRISYSLSYKGTSYLKSVDISMTLADGRVLGVDPGRVEQRTGSSDNTFRPLYNISESVRERFNELRLTFTDNYAVTFRVYNEGVAHRFETSLPGELTVESEQCDFSFCDNYPVYFHPILSEAEYRIQRISDIENDPNYSSLPVLVRPGDGVSILIHESDVLDYPCMSVSSLQGNILKSSHSRVPKSVEPGGHINYHLVVTDTEPFIAKTNGERSFPWRITAFAGDDKDILTNQLVYMLASDNKIGDASWVRPGKVAWDWWGAMNLTGVPFETGINTETYKYYIDFAARNGIEYVNMDEGWSERFNLLKVNSAVDMPELMRYAKERNVGIFLWCPWRILDGQLAEAMAQFERWGVAGLKVDFIDRDDQIAVRSQENILREAAGHKMLVNYHGAYHPTGMSRTYPNNINVEGVQGLEWNKFGATGASPDQAVLLPYIRMFAGSMDYTPGAMQNYSREEWKRINDRPMSQGTRCQQLAMYVVYYAPLQMLSDSPTVYESDP